MARKKKMNAVDLTETKAKFTHVADEVKEQTLDVFLKENFIPYAWSYNLDRALVTSYEGIKPVHKRILYCMYVNGLHPNANRSKVATLAGKTMEWHPHGDSSLVGAIKNLALPFMFRVPMIDGKGDFGSPGTPGAAGRYIEARLSEAGWLNVQEIKENAVPMVPNYDGSTLEPAFIPMRFPASIINGTQGIAIGYASNIPNHNPTEVMEACKELVRNPEATLEDIMTHIKGPDFYMGGQILSTDPIKEYLETGSGTFVTRGIFELTTLPRGVQQIDFFEIPSNTDPGKIIAAITKGIVDGNRFKDIDEYKDLSDLKNSIKIRITTKSGANYKKVLEELYKYTPLESNFSVNMTTIVNGKPMRTGVIPILKDFIEHRKVCIKNKTEYRLNKLFNKLHLQEGLVLILDKAVNIDKAIAIIRKSDNEEKASVQLQKHFKLTPEQAAYILNISLKRLTKMDVIDVKSEVEELKNTIKDLETLLTDAERIKQYLLDEFDETISIIGLERETEILNYTTEELEELKKKKRETEKLSNKDVDCYITMFHNKTILKTLEPFHYDEGLKSAKNGIIVNSIKASTNKSFFVINKFGEALAIKTENVSFDEPVELSSVVGDNFNPISIIPETSNKKDIIFIASSLGKARVIKNDFVDAIDKINLVSLVEGDGDVMMAKLIEEKDIKNKHVLTVSSNNKASKYKLSSLRPSGSGSQLVASHGLGKDDKVVYVGITEDTYTIASQTDNYLKVTPVSEIPEKGRGAQGVILEGSKEEVIQAFTSASVPFAVKNARNNIFELPASTNRALKGDKHKAELTLGEL